MQIKNNNFDNNIRITNNEKDLHSKPSNNNKKRV